MFVDMNASPRKIFTHRIEKKGLFNVNSVYKNIREWFSEANYRFFEKENTTNKRDKGVEIKMTLMGEREITDYFKFEIQVKFLIIETEKVKAKNVMVDRGEFRAYMTATLILDYKHRWAKNKLAKFLRFIYNNLLVKKKIDDVYEPGLKFEAEDLFNNMKAVLGMYD